MYQDKMREMRRMYIKELVDHGSDWVTQQSDRKLRQWARHSGVPIATTVFSILAFVAIIGTAARLD